MWCTDYNFQATEKLVVFLMGVMSHQVSEVLWNGIGVDQGFLTAMAYVSIGGYHTCHGWLFLVTWTMRESLKFAVQKWSLVPFWWGDILIQWVCCRNKYNDLAVEISIMIFSFILIPDIEFEEWLKKVTTTNLKQKESSNKKQTWKYERVSTVKLANYYNFAYWLFQTNFHGSYSKAQQAADLGESRRWKWLANYNLSGSLLKKLQWV